MSNRDPNALGERHDRGGGDRDLIDPGPIRARFAAAAAEKAAREALRQSKPGPM